jgi:hypothetical protein
MNAQRVARLEPVHEQHEFVDDVSPAQVAAVAGWRVIYCCDLAHVRLLWR